MAAINVYDIVTDRIIEQLKRGKIPWKKPWYGVRSGAFNRVTKRPYSLLNQMLLCRKGEYATFKQWSALGGTIKKGAKSEIVVFWKMFDTKETDPDTGDENEKMIPILRYYRVFHIEDVEGVDPLEEYKPEEVAINPIDNAENLFHDYIEREGITLTQTKSDSASYSPVRDRIQLPLMEQFISASEYYSTAFHEAIHSTGHSTRCNRVLSGGKYSKEYAKEELIAELGASYLLNYCDIQTPESETNNVAYIQSWLSCLENDNRFIVSAAGKAEKAVKYFISGNLTEESKNDEEKEILK